MCTDLATASKETACASEHEVEVTPEMIEAGVNIFEDEKEIIVNFVLVENIYRAMERARYRLLDCPRKDAVRGHVIEINNGCCQNGFKSGQQLLVGRVGRIGHDGVPRVWEI